MDEYETDKWRLVAAKVGSGFSPTACQEKAEELEVQEEYDEGTGSDSQTSASAPMQPYTASSDPHPSVSAPMQPPYATSADSQPAISAPMQAYTYMSS